MSGGDPDPNRLMARVVDKVDSILFAHGLEFKDEKDWEDFIERLRSLFFEFYEDNTGGDSDYDPDAPPDSTGTEESESATLGDDEQEEQEFSDE